MSNALKEVREKKGLTQDKVARELNITTRTYQYLESGKINPTIPRALSLARILETPLEILFHEDYSREGVLGK